MDIFDNIRRHMTVAKKDTVYVKVRKTRFDDVVVYARYKVTDCTLSDDGYLLLLAKEMEY